MLNLESMNSNGAMTQSSSQVQRKFARAVWVIIRYNVLLQVLPETVNCQIKHNFKDLPIHFFNIHSFQYVHFQGVSSVFCQNFSIFKMLTGGSKPNYSKLSSSRQHIDIVKHLDTENVLSNSIKLFKGIK